jgi:hypothetical protein
MLLMQLRSHFRTKVNQQPGRVRVTYRLHRYPVIGIHMKTLLQFVIFATMPASAQVWYTIIP